jgi:hypothetical protein
MVVGLCEIIAVGIQSLDEEQVTPLFLRKKKGEMACCVGVDLLKNMLFLNILSL